MAEKTKPNRIKIKEMIEAGDCTKEMLEAELKISTASLATNFSYLRMMGFYPVANGEEKILSFVTEDVWEQMKAERATNGASRASARTPDERVWAARKRLARCLKAHENAEAKSIESDDKVLALKEERAEIDKQIAELELGRLTKELGDIGLEDPNAEPEEASDEVEEDAGDDGSDDLV